jgi:hypothetical protein
MSRIEHQLAGDDPRLHGRWVFERTEIPTTKLEDGAEIEFRADGTLLCKLTLNGQPCALRRTYAVDGLQIVVRNGADPENRACYAFDDQGNLIFEVRSWRTWYRRPSDRAGQHAAGADRR